MAPRKRASQKQKRGITNGTQASCQSIQVSVANQASKQDDERCAASCYDRRFGPARPHRQKKNMLTRAKNRPVASLDQASIGGDRPFRWNGVSIDLHVCIARCHPFSIPIDRTETLCERLFLPHVHGYWPVLVRQLLDATRQYALSREMLRALMRRHSGGTIFTSRSKKLRDGFDCMLGGA